MGAKLTVFENKSNVDMEIRVFVIPSRPDRYRKIIRIRAGESKVVKFKYLCSEGEINEDYCKNPTFLMVFVDGIYSGLSLFPIQIAKYAKILGYVDQNTGNLLIKGIKTRFSCFFLLK